MVDPVSIAVIAAIGGVAGKFVDKVWYQGEKWITNYYKDHAPKAMENAQQNSLQFLSELAKRVKNLEEQGEPQKKVIEESLSNPDFSALLQKAMMSSAQTEDKRKHDILARLVADRLLQGSESLFSLTCQLASDAISKLNINQMKILGVLATIFFIRPTPFPPTNMSQQKIDDSWSEWLGEKLSFGQDIKLNAMDFLHLESLSCIKWEPYLERELEELINFPKDSGIKFVHASFSQTEVGKTIVKLWESGLGGAFPTTVGILIGIYVSDMLLNTTTSLDGWGESFIFPITEMG